MLRHAFYIKIKIMGLNYELQQSDDIQQTAISKVKNLSYCYEKKF